MMLVCNRIVERFGGHHFFHSKLYTQLQLTGDYKYNLAVHNTLVKLRPRLNFLRPRTRKLFFPVNWCNIHWHGVVVNSEEKKIYRFDPIAVTLHDVLL